jgi:hypothetical protein
MSAMAGTENTHHPILAKVASVTSGLINETGSSLQFTPLHA